MHETVTSIGRHRLQTFVVNTAVVGTGAAGYNAADRLWLAGQRDIAMVTEGVNAGTSRNTGSDKQTYYKLTLSGGEPDSVREMAETLFAGQCVDGEHALCEAALSAQGFMRLAELGVPFPRSRYGEYVGYKTDHDPRRRATSAGPYTSRMMTECLQRSVEGKGIRVLDGLQVVRILTSGGAVEGLLCLALANSCFVLVRCKNVIYATGGPAGMYADSVYPPGHLGATGIAFEAGVAGKNLTEWQYGLASVAPRWNVSGTFMQALPCFVSANPDGTEPREFLYDYFEDEAALLDMVFLKGYQWPFDVCKAKGGSSIIDLLVYLEAEKGRRVYLDFRTNPHGKPVDFATLCPEAREYLEKAGACFGTPLERLQHMNAPAVDFYRERGVDLAAGMLEIALCAQHNNGGLAVDGWWQTNVQGFFAVGEAAATHGVYRPGGSALNAGQVGSTRAAQYVAARCGGMPAPAFSQGAQDQAADAIAMAGAVLCHGGADTLPLLWEEATRRMSLYGGPVRNSGGIAEAVRQVRQALEGFRDQVRISHPAKLAQVYRLWDILLCQLVYLGAMADYAETGGKSRGGALYTDPAGEKPHPALPDTLAFTLDDGARGRQVQEVLYSSEEGCRFHWRPVRPIPQDDDFFENVWRRFREDGNVY